MTNITREEADALLAQIHRIEASLDAKDGEIADLRRRLLCRDSMSDLTAERDRLAAQLAETDRERDEALTTYEQNVTLLTVERTNLVKRTEALTATNAKLVGALERIVVHEEATDRGDAYTATEARAALAGAAKGGG